MAQFDYIYNTTPRRPRRSRLRGFVIFLVVTAVTAGVIYAIVPHGNKQEKSSGNTASPAEKTEERSAAPEKLTPPVVEENILPQTENITDETAGTDGIETDAPAKSETATDLPVKGVAWSGDPAVDKPSNPVSQTQATEESAVSSSNWQSVIDNSSDWCTKHSVVRGDSLERIARRYNTTVALLKQLNKLKSDTIYIGRKLVVVPGPWRIEVSKSSRRLNLYRNSDAGKKLFAAYDIGIGRAGSTPTAEFVISIRLRHPEYLAPDGGVHAYNTPENPLGDYFLKLAQPQSVNRPLAGYGIHGTGNDADVGRSLSHGCIRMKNEEVKQLYLLCPVGTPVCITD